ncbi:MAG: serine/threonine protein kinase [Acidobacteria bacterium]|nr:serine/threonine protein kinase [Acidobacteriota bacterium]
MTLTSGTRLGPYDITALIGIGGMGEVYRARDTTLGRDVAIKVLPEAFAHDSERLARFEREAKVLASLNHPNIAQIYDLEKSAGIHALVMELVEGPTLAEIVAGSRLSDDSREALVSIFPLDGTSTVRRLTFVGKNRFPIWSPDGLRVAFQSDREGDLGIFTQRADGTGTTGRLTRPAKAEAHAPESWSRDGKTLVFTVQEGATYSLWSLSIESAKSAPLGDVRSTQPIDPVFSPDGRWIAYRVEIGNEALSSSSGVYVQPFPPTGARYQAPRVIADFHPVWTPDGDSLVYVPSANSGRMAIVRVMKDRGVTFGVPMMAPAVVTGGVYNAVPRAYDILPDGRFVGLVVPDDPLSTGGAANQIRVVVNWHEELKRLVPVN